jgi:hypothetical protein
VQAEHLAPAHGHEHDQVRHARRSRQNMQAQQAALPKGKPTRHQIRNYRTSVKKGPLCETGHLGEEGGRIGAMDKEGLPACAGGGKHRARHYQLGQL